MYRGISRRDFLKATGGMAAGGLLASSLPAFAQDGVTIRSHTRTGRQADEQRYWGEIFNEDNAGEINAVIEDFPNTEYFQKINTLAAGGTIGDVFWISSIEGYFRLAATGVARPIDELIEESGYALDEHYGTTTSAARLNGQLYGIPILAHPGRVGLFYNKAVFDDAGVDYPDDTWTYDDLLAAAIELNDPDRRIWGFMEPGAYFSTIVYIRAWGGDTLNAEGTESLLNTDEAKAALRYQTGLYTEHGVAPAPGTTGQGANQLFAANQLAMYQSGFWGSSVEQLLEDPSVLGVAPMPIGPSGQRGSMFEFDPLCISSSSENPAEAFKFVDRNTNFEAQLRATLTYNVTSSRPAVMTDPDVQGKTETLKVFSGIMEDALPLVLPANFRETEHFKFVGDNLQALWLGLATVDDIIEDVNAGAQAILDKPALG